MKKLRQTASHEAARAAGELVKVLAKAMSKSQLADVLRALPARDLAAFIDTHAGIPKMQETIDSLRNEIAASNVRQLEQTIDKLTDRLQRARLEITKLQTARARRNGKAVAA